MSRILLSRNKSQVVKSFIRYSSFNYKDLPEESKRLLDRIIRVDHAGEFGANQIYKGQLAVLGRTSVGPIIQVNFYNLIQS